MTDPSRPYKFNACWIDEKRLFGGAETGKPRFFLLVAILCAFSVHASAQSQRRIVLITLKTEGFRNAFWDALRSGGESAAQEAGFGFEYRGLSPDDGESAASAQERELRTATDSGAAGILFTPVDRFRTVGAVKYAVLKGVPVVSIDSAVESNLVSGIAATNGYEGGLDAARRMAELMGGKGDVVALAHPSRENKATQDRERSFAEGIRRFAPEIRLVSADRFGDGTIDGDTRAALGLIRDFPSLRGAYAVSGSGLVGFLRALKETGKAGSVFLIGWDADAESLKALSDGYVHGIMQQDPETMARKGVELLAKAIRGNPERKTVAIPATLILPQNLKDPTVRRLLAPIAGAAPAGN